MSFGLGVLAIDGWTDVSEVIAMVDRCEARDHVEGDLDQRIVGFYERLRARFPDHPPYLDPSDDPWMSAPDVGIDHVFMLLSHGQRSDAAVGMIIELAIEYGLTIWDPQEGSAYRPVRAPSREDVVAWWRDLLDGRCSRTEIHERVRQWVEDPPEPVADPITVMGLQHLHGFGLCADDRVDRRIRAAFEQWLVHGERFDADPAGWQRERYLEAVAAVLREQGPWPARVLANRLVARDWLSAEDVARLLGPTH